MKVTVKSLSGMGYLEFTFESEEQGSIPAGIGDKVEELIERGSKIITVKVEEP
jgi:hypothetical protein